MLLSMAAFQTLCASAIFLILINVSTSNSQYSQKPIKGVYYPSWSRDDLSPSAINTTYFTHIYYAFLVPNNVTFKFDIDKITEAPFLKDFTSTLQAKEHPVRTLFSIGGGNVGPALFSRMADHPSSRAAFINSTIEVARTYGFNGFDLDWEFPQDRKDMENLAHLLEEWRHAVQTEAKAIGKPQLLITAAVYYSADTFLSGAQRAYPVDSITKNLNWVNVMNYDYHGSWDTSVTGAHAALYDPKSNLSTSFRIGSWIRAGVPGSKLVMGMPLYGRTWELKDTRLFGVGAPAVGVGPGEDGALTFAQVVKFNKDHKAKVVFDSETVSMYSVAGKSWIGYDDVTSVALKIGFARALELRGYFFWDVHGDYKWRISKKGLRNYGSALWEQKKSIHAWMDGIEDRYSENITGFSFA
ncbi:hypothetical protein OROHE_022628 [Orobanche hederae]